VVLETYKVNQEQRARPLPEQEVIPLLEERGFKILATDTHTQEAVRRGLQFSTKAPSAQELDKWAQHNISAPRPQRFRGFL